MTTVANVSDLLARRYACRDLGHGVVTVDEIEEILRAGVQAPSALNQQSYFFYGIQGRSLELAAQIRPWYGASALILGCLFGQSWVRPSDQQSYGNFDLGLAMMPMALRATELGLDSCFIASFDPHKWQQLLAIPPEHKPVAVLALGFGEPGVEVKHTRKNVSECRALLN